MYRYYPFGHPKQAHVGQTVWAVWGYGRSEVIECRVKEVEDWSLLSPDRSYPRNSYAVHYWVEAKKKPFQYRGGWPDHRVLRRMYPKSFFGFGHALSFGADLFLTKREALFEARWREADDRRYAASLLREKNR